MTESQQNKMFETELKELKKRLFNTSLKTYMLVIIMLVEIFVVVTFLYKKGFLPVAPKEGDKIAVVNFDEEITVDSIHKVMEEMDTVLKDDEYKEYLFIMNSPGGSPSASEEMSEYLKEINKQKKVTMYVEAVAASGGYYIASAIRPVIANKNAMVGSIGVIMPHYNFKSLADKVGVEEDFIAAGEFKKPVSYFQPIDKKNKDYLTQAMLSPMYENFVNSVAVNRGLKAEEIKKVAEGKVFLANNPEIKGVLVDEVSSLYQTKENIKKRYKNGIEFQSIQEEKDSGFFGPLNAKLSVNLANSPEATSSVTLK